MADFKACSHSVRKANFTKPRFCYPRTNGAKRGLERVQGEARVTNSARLFTHGEKDGKADSKVGVIVGGWSSH